MTDRPTFPDLDPTDFTDRTLDRLSVYMREVEEWRKAHEKAYTFPGADFTWWTEIPPIRAWATKGHVLCAIGTGGATPAFCGYVQLPEAHPWLTLDLQRGAVDVEVHGGITFGPHLTRWIGFDTAHAWDNWDWGIIESLREAIDPETFQRWSRMRNIMLEVRQVEHPTYDRHWTMEALTQEVEHLARQVAAASQ